MRKIYFEWLILFAGLLFTACPLVEIVQGTCPPCAENPSLSPCTASCPTCTPRTPIVYPTTTISPSASQSPTPSASPIIMYWNNDGNSSHSWDISKPSTHRTLVAKKTLSALTIADINNSAFWNTLPDNYIFQASGIPNTFYHEDALANSYFYPWSASSGDTAYPDIINPDISYTPLAAFAYNYTQLVYQYFNSVIWSNYRSPMGNVKAAWDENHCYFYIDVQDSYVMDANEAIDIPINLWNISPRFSWVFWCAYTTGHVQYNFLLNNTFQLWIGAGDFESGGTWTQTIANMRDSSHCEKTGTGWRLLFIMDFFNANNPQLNGNVNAGYTFGADFTILDFQDNLVFTSKKYVTKTSWSQTGDSVWSNMNDTGMVRLEN